MIRAMGLRTSVGNFLTPPHRRELPALTTRSIDSFVDEPGLTEQLLYAQGLRSTPYRAMGIRDALSIPAYLRAAQLVAGLIGGLPLLAYRNGQLLNPTPRIVARPDPFQIVRNFLFGVGWNVATRGEAILYAAAVDTDGEPLSILNLPTHEVTVEWADESQLVKSWSWRGRRLAPDRVRHVPYICPPGELRGVGPLQLIGAAVSAAVEADEWAARYFAESGLTSVHLHSEAKLTDAEADVIRERWIGNVGSVRVTSGGLMTSNEFGTSPHDAQLIEARMHARGEAAVAFGIPGKLLEYASAGSSLTYENVGELMTDFARSTLAPMYLVPIEQSITDFLVRSLTVRFDLDELLRPDPRTRFDIHKIAIEAGIYPAAYAAQVEGISSGDPSTAPVPAPGPIPTGLPSAEGGTMGIPIS
jgi:phage portal protein BeeE